VVAVLILVIIFYLGWKSPNFKKMCFTIAKGVIIYAIGENIIVEPVLAAFAQAYGKGIRIVLFFLQLILKASGLIIFSFGVTKFVVVFSKEK
jgi:hypothetical protein